MTQRVVEQAAIKMGQIEAKIDIIVSPNYSLYLEDHGDSLKNKSLEQAFQRGLGFGLLALDSFNLNNIQSESFSYWQDFVRIYLALFAATPELESVDLNKNSIHIEFPEEDLNRLLLTVPPVKGSEYINADSLKAMWAHIENDLHIEIQESEKSISDYFSTRHSKWSLLGRVCFHLAENKNSEETPFAFLATYAHQLSKEGKAKHLPLGRALEEYSGAKNKALLLRLLAPIHKATIESEFLKEVVNSSAIYHPQAWSPTETYKFLKDIPLFEKSGIVVKVPNWWKPKNPTSPQISISIGDKKPGGVGLNALLDFSASLVMGNSEVSEKDIQDLLSRSENLVFFKGQWVAVDQDKLTDLLSKWKQIGKHIRKDGLSFAESIRWLSGIESGDGVFDTQDTHDIQVITRVVPGAWLKEALNELRSPETDKKLQSTLSKYLRATLRPYQNQGVAWLYALNQMQMGAILADDMGLGKTIQIIALLLIKKHFEQTLTNKKQNPALLVVPASLIGNWQSELVKFGPSLKIWIAHASGDGVKAPAIVDLDVVMTTYSALTRMEWLSKQEWSLHIADEAQAIKNPSAKQTKAIKGLKSLHKLALTGTPVENNLSDLWSLFDFVLPGLLGSAKSFDSFIKSKKNHKNPYLALRQLVRPYILRRLKTDKSVISDLPDKTELKSYCPLTQSQVVLYQKSVEALTREIAGLDGIKRRGVVLSYLMRFKQICNHPAQFVKSGEFSLNQSGKFQRLKELCEVIVEKQEKVLIFTQFKEMTGPIAEFLETIFNKQGLVLHGETSIKKRAEMVTQFQQESGPPFFVLSLKTGGTGLNLTHASHVIHFDRWWNPAVENQATDRAFRIGQKKNVLVHKFICKGTLEEKIDALIDSKKNISKELLEDPDSSPLLTEMSNEDLLKIVSLDINSATDE
jgi:non-specific serine/threonine protein kinase